MKQEADVDQSYVCCTARINEIQQSFPVPNGEWGDGRAVGGSAAVLFSRPLEGELAEQAPLRSYVRNRADSTKIRQ